MNYSVKIRRSCKPEETFKTDVNMQNCGILDDNTVRQIDQEVSNWRFPIYRLGVTYDNYNNASFDKMSKTSLMEAVNNLIKELNSVPLPPDRIFVSEWNDEITVSADWGLPFPIIPTTIEDSKTILANFFKYTASFPFAKAKLELGLFHDDPVNMSDEQEFLVRILGLSTNARLIEKDSLETAKCINKEPEVYWC